MGLLREVHLGVLLLMLTVTGWLHHRLAIHQGPTARKFFLHTPRQYEQVSSQIQLPVKLRPTINHPLSEIMVIPQIKPQ